MTREVTSKWVGDVLESHVELSVGTEWESIYDERLEKCDPVASDCHYWCAVAGSCYGLKSLTPANSCISGVQNALYSVGHDRREVYVTFSLKGRTAGTWERWVAKWAKRSADRKV